MTPSEQAEAWVAKTLTALKEQSRVVPTGEVAYSAWLNGHAHGLASLRDQFAMAALGGDWASQSADSGHFPLGASTESLATNAELYYRMADAMLDARKEKK